jgi:YbbR domain-containing protein
MRLKVDTIALRLASVALALSLWFSVAAHRNAEAPIDAPLEFRNVPDKLELVGEIPRRVEVWLRGSPGLVQRVEPGDVYVQVDLKQATPGPRTIEIATTDVHVPYAVTVAAVRPATFSFLLEPSLQRKLPVKARLSGRPANGFRVSGVKCEPEEFVVVGPKSRLADLDQLETQPVEIDQAQITLVREVRVDLPDPLLRLVSPRAVRVVTTIAAVPKP